MSDLYYKKYNQVNIEQNAIYYTKDGNNRWDLLMHKALQLLEEKFAETVSQNGGDILEIGFGMGLSANKFIDSNINSYTCIEINNTVYQSALTWAQGKPNVTILNNNWEEALQNISQKYDGIYFDGLDTDYYEFYDLAKRVLNPGAVIATYGAGVYFGESYMNVIDGISPPLFFDSTYTQQMHNNLVSKGYYKVCYQYFNGNGYVKQIGS
jgi:spermidine synthase